MDNVIEAAFRGGRKDKVLYTRTAHQHDKGVILRVTGLALPAKYEAHFSNDERSGISAAQIMRSNEIQIPDVYFQTGKYVYVWLYFTDEEYGVSQYRIVIPVEGRPAILSMPEQKGRQLVADLDEDDHALFFRFE